MISVYEVCYFQDDEWCGSVSCSDRFEGTWVELQDFIKGLKELGCYNISASFLYEY